LMVGATNSSSFTFGFSRTSTQTSKGRLIGLELANLDRRFSR